MTVTYTAYTMHELVVLRCKTSKGALTAGS